MYDENCLFCKIINAKIPSEKVFENEKIYAFKDINPTAPQHILIIPKIHIESLDMMEDHHKELFGEIMFTASKLAKEIGFNKEGYRVVANTNDFGGQTVHHFHLHLIGGRKLIWPPG